MYYNYVNMFFTNVNFVAKKVYVTVGDNCTGFGFGLTEDGEVSLKVIKYAYLFYIFHNIVSTD